jgi:hypothetical protein
MQHLEGSVTPSYIYDARFLKVKTVQHKHSKVISMRGKKEVAFISSAERGNLITVVTCMNATGTYAPPLIVFLRKKYETGAYGWSTGGVSFGLPSKWLDSDGYIC